MFRVAIFLVVGAVALLFSAVSEYWLSWKTSSEPQQITIQELMDNGPGDNYFVEISDYDFGGQIAVLEKGNQVSEAWIPMVTLNDNYTCKVILHTTDVTSEAGLGAIAMQPTIRGVVTNDLSGLKSKQRRQLKGAYGIDYDNVIVVAYNQEPTGFGLLLVKLIGAVALVGGAYFAMAAATGDT